MLKGIIVCILAFNSGYLVRMSNEFDILFLIGSVLAVISSLTYTYWKD